MEGNWVLSQRLLWRPLGKAIQVNYGNCLNCLDYIKLVTIIIFSSCSSYMNFTSSGDLDRLSECTLKQIFSILLFLFKQSEM